MKYDVPKIYLVDVNKELLENLSNEGFNVAYGTFGCHYYAEPDDECGLNHSLNYLTEQDIIIVDMNESGYASQNPLLNKQWSNGDGTKIQMQQNNTIMNPRYFSAREHLHEFTSIVQNGGILIIFSSQLKEQSYHFIEVKGGRLYNGGSEIIDNYAWIPQRYNIAKNTVLGKEIIPNPKYQDIYNKIFSDCDNDLIYECSFSVYEDDREYALCTNRLGETISYLKEYNTGDIKGYLLILPQVADKRTLLNNLLKTFLPELKPELFPDFVKNNWVDSNEYLMPQIKDILNKRESITNDYNRKLDEIETEFKEKSEEFRFLIETLTSNGYDDFLVQNVKKSLEYIGYKEIVNIDEEVIGNKQEDLRIDDYGSHTIVEVKGHNGNPTEDDCQALLKYINRNMKKTDRTDIHGILIVNHHKLKPPFERPIPAFTQPQIDDALRDGYTLVSTWELYKSIRLYQEGLVTFDEIHRDLHTKGLYRAIPTHWEYVGKIEKLFKDGTVACIFLNAESVKIGSELIIHNGNDFFKMVVGEMMVDGKKVEISTKGDKLSIKIVRPIQKQAHIYVRQPNE